MKLRGERERERERDLWEEHNNLNESVTKMEIGTSEPFGIKVENILSSNALFMHIEF